MLAKAREMLEELPVRDVVSWNALIAGYAQQGRDSEVLNCFELMQSHGLSPDAITFICILKACGSTRAVDKGEQIHREIVNRGLLESDIVLANALMDMYARCGHLTKAHRLLEELPIQDVITWNALITGYVQEGRNHEALNCFESMQSKGLHPSAATFVCCLKACGGLGATEKGEQIHEAVSNRGMLKDDLVLGNSLVDMYAKCGELEKAQGMLEELPFRNVISWNALIAGYAQCGQGRKGLDCFERMRNDGILPDDVSFLYVVRACNRSGMLSEARTVLTDMPRMYGIAPNKEHHSHIVLLLASAGDLEQAMAVIDMTPHSDRPAVWLAVLSACRRCGNVMLARLVFDRAFVAEMVNA
jgi:pentatricopeptide repeat protein